MPFSKLLYDRELLLFTYIIKTPEIIVSNNKRRGGQLFGFWVGFFCFFIILFYFLFFFCYQTMQTDLARDEGLSAKPTTY